VYEARLQWQWNLRVMLLWSALFSGMLLTGTGNLITREEELMKWY
jgi:hypothetical protein